MTSSKWQLGLVAFSLTSASISVQAQVIPDATLPINSAVTQEQNRFQIDGGTPAGTNLFHSFGEFSLPTGTEAFFNNSTEIVNIITRVTGGGVSNLDGLIRANGIANLFLINPNGIVFGPNARLQIGGSFLGSTAESLLFSDGSEFSATNPQAPPLLTINVPIGLQYGSDPASIVVQASQASTEEGEGGLRVGTGKALSLVGGSLKLDNAFLLAPGGRIELGALAESGIVGLSPEGHLSFPSGVSRADILLTNGTEVTVRGEMGGDIAVTTGNLTLQESSTLKAGIAAGMGSPDAQAGDIDINATNNVTIIGPDSFISNAILGDAMGNGGDLRISTGALMVLNGGQIFAATLGKGNVGDIEINVRDTARFDGAARENENSSAALNLVYGMGQGGNISLSAGTLTLTNGAAIQASTFGHGNAGNIILNIRDRATFDGSSWDGFSTGVYSRSETSETVGDGGNISLSAGSVFVTNGAVITGSTEGQGRGGNINLFVRDQTVLDGLEPIIEKDDLRLSSGLFSTVKKTGVGTAGDINVFTGSLSITNGAVIITRTDGQGRAGNILVNAQNFVSVSGFGLDFSGSGLFAQTELEAVGDAGDIVINTPSFQISQGAVVNARTSNNSNGGNIVINTDRFEALTGGQLLTFAKGQGQAGNITINATEGIFLSGSDPTFFERQRFFNTIVIGDNQSPASAIYANTEKESTGGGGSLNLQADSIILKDGAEISVTSNGSGASGNLNILAPTIRLDNSKLTAETNAGEFGNIGIQTEDIRLRNNSNITTNAQGSARGGNIVINTEKITALENSDITANSVQGNGGRVVINAQGIFGTNYREQENPRTSDITATSDLGAEFNGTVELNLPIVDPASGLINLQEKFVNAETLIDQRCLPGNTQRSSFIITGTGGLPLNPTTEPLSSDQGWVDRRFSDQQIYPNPPVKSRNIVEAQGWIIHENGMVELVAEITNSRPNSSSIPVPSCPEI
ncbi:conserved exported hypothetical protein [Planktothrix sp. PCC 11201]|uniref:two-partner secretion domain-containing protein n=1 Tax=Planktothrix sp. PCC 11201 TaxID=1729650 RepID=UPI00091E7506|nr:S-layer family protein [Planktothrix sp. PCC 11201]SKB11921.1 conserved exported hypothetical protein [Planktothrix sp. PCC 11201]